MLQSLSNGVTFGLFDISLYTGLASVMLYGSFLVADRQLTGGDVIIVLFVVVFGLFGLAQALPHITHFRAATIAGARVFALLERYVLRK